MKFTTISGEVKELKRLRSPGETSAYFKIDDQCVRLFTRRPVIKEGDRVVVAGKFKRDQFISYAMHNLTQSTTTEQSRSTKLVPYIFGSLFTGIGLALIIDHIFHAPVSAPWVCRRQVQA